MIKLTPTTPSSDLRKTNLYMVYFIIKRHRESIKKFAVSFSIHPLPFSSLFLSIFSQLSLLLAFFIIK